METIHSLSDQETSLVPQFNQVIQDLVVLNGMQESYSKIYIPFELVSTVDSGESVDNYYASMLEHAQNLNSSLNTRIKSLKQFHSKISDAFSKPKN